ncbi:ABC transporter substrate-binding protein [Bradyrhizobium sp. GCM10023182]|uniref:ABC transporter substrate-binding protein n=1 Tax=Bradyrhizobium zhengyangense TaxID=2911009 RepID=A0ABS9LIG9_9BRAD|nr:ABC transporter substrate-binding protein [Bradyrhizobium zhengyangense]MCG2666802.1 ABC transporter substrate-binding protein [Bradyrhizobium zhengyangense]
MRRRDFISLTATAVIGLPHIAYGQTKATVPVIGVLAPIKENTDLARLRLAALRMGLKDEGLIEGTSYSLAARFLEGDFNRVEPLVQELGSLKPRLMVIASMGIGATHKLYPDLPIVFTAVAADPISLGLAQSYVHPGGSITGNVMNAVGGEETMAQKRLGFFRELIPGLKRIGIIGPSTGPLLIKEKKALQKVADQAGFEITFYNVRTPDDLEGAFASGRRDEVSAFYISGEPILFSNMARVMSFVTLSGRPAFGPYPEWGRAGLLLSYSTDPMEGWRNAGAYAGKILKGAKPGELPILQASKFVLVINQRTARSLGIAVPPSLLALADEVVE